MTLPIHRQFGSKARVAQQILALVPSNKRVWVEVFAGSAAVTLAKAPHPVEHINDLSGHVTNLFRVVRDPILRLALQEAIEMTPYAQSELIACRQEMRQEDPVEWARRFLVVSWLSVNGCHTGNTGFRLNRDQDWHLRVWNRLGDRIAAACRRLKEVTIHSRHCLEIVKVFGDLPDAVLFLDPPYPLSTTNTKRQQVYEVDMSNDEHEALASALRDVKASVILTMNPGTIYSDILNDWHISPMSVRGLRNATKTELVFTNFAPSIDLFRGAAA
ncbi:DNA adenine methylase [Telmatospirillum sp.]|uniref:DNA adenine methylase n=1 Tax=Telmatospirillum sp. TaxID=2079197 RepID=UPI0028448F53|nr:DNA adenine methylase [Telmatospirillum sp.]MDR3439864.1 DNA adenine methylase [Telmatospirillum sp.]